MNKVLMSERALIMNRDDYTRCKVCKELFLCTPENLDPDKGYVCPKGCEMPYNQDPYESPFNDE
jgi:hypothetical protein